MLPLETLTISGSPRRGVKGEVKRGEVVGERTGPEGERGGEMREKGGREGARKRTRKTLILLECRKWGFKRWGLSKSEDI